MICLNCGKPAEPPGKWSPFFCARCDLRRVKRMSRLLGNLSIFGPEFRRSEIKDERVEA